MTTTSMIGGEEQSLLTFSRLSHLEQARGLVSAIQALSLARSVAEIQAIVRSAARRLTGADGATFVLRDGTRCFYADDRIPHAAYRPTFVRSLAMVPIRTREPIGAIGTYWAVHHLPTEQEVELLQALADSTAVAMENVRAYQELEDARMETLQRLAIAGEYRDDATYEHTERVARTAGQVALKLGLTEEAALLIRQAAPLHDIGKLAVADAILRKPGLLTPAESEQIRRHPAAGATILAGSQSRVLRLAQEIALSHHEWWDGSGYPLRLKGEAIPISGRIVALADVFDALTHERPYKPAWPVEEAAAEIRRLSGSQFDPEVCVAFSRLDPATLVRPVAPSR